MSHEELRWNDMQNGHCTATKLLEAPAPEPLVTLSLSATAPDGVKCQLDVGAGDDVPSAACGHIIRISLSPCCLQLERVALQIRVKNDIVGERNNAMKCVADTSSPTLNPPLTVCLN